MILFVFWVENTLIQWIAKFLHREYKSRSQLWPIKFTCSKVLVGQFHTRTLQTSVLVYHWVSEWVREGGSEWVLWLYTQSLTIIMKAHHHIRILPWPRDIPRPFLTGKTTHCQRKLSLVNGELGAKTQLTWLCPNKVKQHVNYKGRK